ncbi:MAG: thioesterase family protein [Phyllobacteriaceae bacterium]|nr:thioesterase family protein [Phyllobacteriaceae bacterium]
MHIFDAAIALGPLGEGRFAGKTSPAYANMAGPYGGITAAVLLNAVMIDPRRMGDPVAETVNYCGALADGPFEIATTLVRGGKYTQHWSLTLTQDGQIRSTASVVCGARGAVFTHTESGMPEAPPPEAVAAIPVPGPLKWLDAYDLRYVGGAPQFAAKPFASLLDSRSLLWVADRPARPLDFPALASIADAFLPRIVKARGLMVPLGTVSLTTYFHATAPEIARLGAGPVLGVAQAKRMHANFFDQHMELWSRDGQLLATGAQVAWYRE